MTEAKRQHFDGNMGVVWQLAAVQQTPCPQLPIPVHAVLQELP